MFDIQRPNRVKNAEKKIERSRPRTCQNNVRSHPQQRRDDLETRPVTKNACGGDFIHVVVEGRKGKRGEKLNQKQDSSSHPTTVAP